MANGLGRYGLETPDGVLTYDTQEDMLSVANLVNEYNKAVNFKNSNGLKTLVIWEDFKEGNGDSAWSQLYSELRLTNDKILRDLTESKTSSISWASVLLGALGTYVIMRFLPSK